MPTFKLPLSGDVVQSINPFTAFMTGGQFKLVTSPDHGTRVEVIVPTHV